MSRSEKGFTLVEVLVAMFIFAVLLIGLLSGLLSATVVDMRNQLQEQAKLVALECAENLRNYLTDTFLSNSSSGCNTGNTVAVITPCTDNTGINVYTVKVRNKEINYRIVWEATPVTGASGLYKTDITVCWDFMNRNYRYTTSTHIRSRTP